MENPEEVLHIPTEAKEVFDVSGAGDTSLATLGVSIASGLSIKDAMKLANLASGLVVAKLGTATISADELKTVLANKQSQDDILGQNRKIVSVEQAQNILFKLKEKNKTIGFTNGCFDCLHLGHLHSFMEARKLCDILVVAINSDSSVRRYKGEMRPMQDEKTRSILLASLEFIDYVIIFDDDTIFERQVEALGQEGDILFGLSTSGNSKNVLLAFEMAHKKGIKTISMTGFSGGKMKDIANFALNVPSDTTNNIQEMHIALGHLLCGVI